MSDIFISYARSTEAQARSIADALRALGYDVWRDDALPAHRAYAEVIEEQLTAAKAVLVIWSAEAVKSQWVRAEAELAREAGTLVQLSIDGARPPLPFNQIQCADMAGWNGEPEAHGWRKVVDSLRELAGPETGPAPAPISETAPPLMERPSVAVLPFTDMAGAGGQDYFADGMVTDITNALSRFKSIFVIASSSTLTFKGKGVSAQQAARQMGVAYVLEGSVRRAANRVRIAVQLIDAADGAQIWAERFDDTLEDVFELQDKVAQSVAGRIGAMLEVAELRRASTRPTANMGSYDLYLQALQLVNSFEKANDLKAIELAHRAIALDPDFGLALAIAAVSHGHVMSETPRPEQQEHRRQAREMAQRALQAAGDDALVLALAADALASSQEDLAFPIGLCDRAISLNPGLTWAWFQSGWMRVRTGQSQLGLEHLETAARIDPLSSSQAHRLSWMGVALFEQRRFSEAVTRLNESAYLLPTYPINPPLLAACHAHLGDRPAARAALAERRARSDIPVEAFARWAFHDREHRELFLQGIALADGSQVN